MKLKNSIGWCDATTNAVTGCEKVSPGCKNCYAEAGTAARILRAKGIETWGPKGVRHPVNFEAVFRRLNKLCVCKLCHKTEPVERLAGNASCDCQGQGPFSYGPFPFRRVRLFVDSNSDWLDPRWPTETLCRFLDAIRLAPNVDVLLLTKRPECFKSRLRKVWLKYAMGYKSVSKELGLWVHRWMNDLESPANVWLGVSVEDQKRADERITELLGIPAAVRFLSVEPLLEKVDLGLKTFCVENGEIHLRCEWERRKHLPNPIFWVIVGGESGKNRRDCGLEAILGVVEQCRAAGVPVWVKQDCAEKPGQQGRIPDEIWNLKQMPK